MDTATGGGRWLEMSRCPQIPLSLERVSRAILTVATVMEDPTPRNATDPDRHKVRLRKWVTTHPTRYQTNALTKKQMTGAIPDGLRVSGPQSPAAPGAQLVASHSSALLNTK